MPTGQVGRLWFERGRDGNADVRYELRLGASASCRHERQHVSVTSFSQD